MKYNFLFCLLISAIPILAQTDRPCRVIQFLHKDSMSSENKLNAIYHPRGFYLLKNGVYDFIIDRRKYFQSILLEISQDSFSISTRWETKENAEQIYDTLIFSINQNIQIRMLRFHNGIGNFPIRTRVRDYIVSIKERNREYCELEHHEIIFEGNRYLGRYHFTQFGFRRIKMLRGRPYLVEKKGDHMVFEDGRVVFVERDRAFRLRRR